MILTLPLSRLVKSCRDHQLWHKSEPKCFYPITQSVRMIVQVNSFTKHRLHGVTVFKAGNKSDCSTPCSNIEIPVDLTDWNQICRFVVDKCLRIRDVCVCVCVCVRARACARTHLTFYYMNHSLMQNTLLSHEVGGYKIKLIIKVVWMH